MVPEADLEDVKSAVRRMSQLDGYPRLPEGEQELVEAFMAVCSDVRSVDELVDEYVQAKPDQQGKCHAPYPATLYASAREDGKPKGETPIRCEKCSDTGWVEVEKHLNGRAHSAQERCSCVQAPLPPAEEPRARQSALERPNQQSLEALL